MLNTLLNFSFNSPDMLTTTTAVEKGYLLTSVTGLYLALRYIQIIEDEVTYFLKLSIACKAGVFFKIATQRYMEEEQARGTRVGRKMKKHLPAEPMNLPNTP